MADCTWLTGPLFRDHHPVNSFQELGEAAKLIEKYLKDFTVIRCCRAFQRKRRQQTMDLFLADEMLMEREYDRSVKYGDPGCMWEDCWRWLLILGGLMRMTRYTNFVLEMFVKFKTMLQKMLDFYEATWLVNLTGKEGKMTHYWVQALVGSVSQRFGLNDACDDFGRGRKQHGSTIHVREAIPDVVEIETLIPTAEELGQQIEEDGDD